MKTSDELKADLKNQVARIDAAELRLKSQMESDRKELRELELRLPYKIAQYYAGDISADELKRVKTRIAELAERIDDAAMADFKALKQAYRNLKPRDGAKIAKIQIVWLNMFGKRLTGFLCK